MKLHCTWGPIILAFFVARVDPMVRDVSPLNKKRYGAIFVFVGDLVQMRKADVYTESICVGLFATLAWRALSGRSRWWKWFRILG